MRRWAVIAALALAAGCATTSISAPVTTETVPTVPTTEPPTTELPTTTSTSTAPPPVTVTAPPGALPNAALTPGEAFPGVTAAQVCQSGWSETHRDVPEAERLAVFAAYGIPYADHDAYELDHLIPLEIGGDNSRANLWPEPHAGSQGSFSKDGLENRLHDLVCSGQLAIGTAQQAIATNWPAALARYGTAG